MNTYDHKIPTHQITEIVDALPEIILITAEVGTKCVYIDAQLLDPCKSQKIINKSLDFAWGYAGSGPALLSLAILLIYLPEKIACNLYQQFKINVVSSWPQGSFGLRINLKEEIEKILSEESYWDEESYWEEQQEEYEKWLEKHPRPGDDYRRCSCGKTDWCNKNSCG